LQLTLPGGANTAEVESVLDAALAQVVAQGVTEAELARARNLFLSSFWKQMATINGKASLLGQ
jgi:zinc protease